MLLPIHVAAGGLAMVLGFTALFAKKGGTIHRRTGLLFVYAMLVMGISGSILGFRNSPADGNVMAGLMTVYFAGTALTTVRPSSRWTSRINATALTIAVGLALLAIVGCGGCAAAARCQCSSDTIQPRSARTRSEVAYEQPIERSRPMCTWDQFESITAQTRDHPNVKANVSTPASRNSISNCRSTIGSGWRTN